MIFACGCDSRNLRGVCSMQEQVASGSPQKWVRLAPAMRVSRKFMNMRMRYQDYCAPKIDYADVRKRVRYAFSEKANEIADAIAVVQNLSAEGSKLLEEIDAQCS